jgi:hypothetical protein
MSVLCVAESPTRFPYAVTAVFDNRFMLEAVTLTSRVPTAHRKLASPKIMCLWANEVTKWGHLESCNYGRCGIEVCGQTATPGVRQGGRWQRINKLTAPMYILDAAIARFSASDVANFLACHHLLTLDIEHGAGHIERPFFRGPSIEFLRALGAKHEHSYLHHLMECPGSTLLRFPRTFLAGKQLHLRLMRSTAA